MTTPLTLVANIEAKAEQVEFVKSELLKLVAPTRLEAGCIQYDLHQDNSNPALFTLLKLGKVRHYYRLISIAHI